MSVFCEKFFFVCFLALSEMKRPEHNSKIYNIYIQTFMDQFKRRNGQIHCTVLHKKKLKEPQKAEQTCMQMSFIVISPPPREKVSCGKRNI